MTTGHTSEIFHPEGASFIKWEMCLLAEGMVQWDRRDKGEVTQVPETSVSTALWAAGSPKHQ